MALRSSRCRLVYLCLHWMWHINATCEYRENEYSSLFSMIDVLNLGMLDAENCSWVGLTSLSDGFTYTVICHCSYRWPPARLLQTVIRTPHSKIRGDAPAVNHASKRKPLAASAGSHNPKHSASPFDVTHFRRSYSADSPIWAIAWVGVRRTCIYLIVHLYLKEAIIFYSHEASFSPFESIQHFVS